MHFIPAAGGHPLTVTSVVLCSFQKKIQNLSPIAAETDLQKYSETVQKKTKAIQNTTPTLCFYISFLFPSELHLKNFLAGCQSYPKAL